MKYLKLKMSINVFTKTIEYKLSYYIFLIGLLGFQV